MLPTQPTYVNCLREYTRTRLEQQTLALDEEDHARIPRPELLLGVMAGTAKYESGFSPEQISDLKSIETSATYTVDGFACRFEEASATPHYIQYPLTLTGAAVSSRLIGKFYYRGVVHWIGAKDRSYIDVFNKTVEQAAPTMAGVATNLPIVIHLINCKANLGVTINRQVVWTAIRAVGEDAVYLPSSRNVLKYIYYLPHGKCTCATRTKDDRMSTSHISGGECRRVQFTLFKKGSIIGTGSFRNFDECQMVFDRLLSFIN